MVSGRKMEKVSGEVKKKSSEMKKANREVAKVIREAVKVSGEVERVTIFRRHFSFLFPLDYLCIKACICEQTTAGKL
jgi:hypothetical protein